MVLLWLARARGRMHGSLLQCKRIYWCHASLLGLVYGRCGDHNYAVVSPAKVEQLTWELSIKESGNTL